VTTLGLVEVIRSDSSFNSETAQPTLPSSDRALSGSTARQSSPRNDRDGGDRLDGLLADSLQASLAVAKANVAAVHSSTTLAALALAYEAADDSASAVASANEALELCFSPAPVAGGKLSDPISARLAIEVLFRANQIDEALAHVSDVRLTPHASLVVGAMLGSAGRYAEAHAFVDELAISGRDPVRGYLLLAEGKNYAAVSALRSALRDAPDDADSALNLSIALSRLGATKKAVAAAAQAARSAPGRQDVCLHYLELLLDEEDYVRLDREVDALKSQSIAEPARLLILQARSQLTRGDIESGIKLLERASVAASDENDEVALVEIRSNLIRIRAARGRISRDIAIEQLLRLHAKHRTAAVVVANLAQVSDRKRHADAIQVAFEEIRDYASESQSAFIEYQIASLRGDGAVAAQKAVEWSTLEPSNAHASIAAAVALGIGQERWTEASEIALEALRMHPEDRTVINNAGYVLAMMGKAEEAVKLLTPYADDGFVLKATLGLAHLASADVATGMKLYRQAASEAEKVNDNSRSLMTAYQALVVRQLGLLDSADATMIAAVSLPAYPLPDDWSDRPEFVRLKERADLHGYGWPLSL
jgi:tetratricopeptide (TPR) repeat protein